MQPLPSPSGRSPAPGQALVAKGREVYAKMGRAACHGEKGTGDGPRRPFDSAGLPIRPFDFTRGGSMKGGSELADIYRTFTTGVDGTPMPSFVEALPDADRWALASYVKSLAAPGAPPPASAGTLTIARAGAVATEPNDAAWRKVAATVVPLRPTHALSFTIDRVEVRAMSDGAKVAFLLEWADPVANQDTLTVDAFRDGAAIQFPLAPVPKGETIFFGMGEKNMATNIWHWKADWQSDVVKVADVASRHPNMAVDMYPDAASRSAADAGNLMPIAPRESPIEDLDATGFSTLTSQPRDQQNVNGKGVYGDGRWRVVFVRSLASSDPRDAKIDGVDTVAFAVWNGAAGDRNGQKAVSEWVPFRMEK
ncbi:MAG: ethylbenzene dehydrogenase-related protein [Acidobacteriota bacterium]